MKPEHFNWTISLSKLIQLMYPSLYMLLTSLYNPCSSVLPLLHTLHTCFFVVCLVLKPINPPHLSQVHRSSCLPTGEMSDWWTLKAFGASRPSSSATWRTQRQWTSCTPRAWYFGQMWARRPSNRRTGICHPTVSLPHVCYVFILSFSGLVTVITEVLFITASTESLVITTTYVTHQFRNIWWLWCGFCELKMFEYKIFPLSLHCSL